ncbi:hypothetical protein ACFX2I_014152 [Malus domestica]
MVDSSFAMGARRQWMDFATHVTNVSTPFSPTIFTNHVLSYPVRSATRSNPNTPSNSNVTKILSQFTLAIPAPSLAEQPNMEDYQTEPAGQQIKHFSHDQHFFILSDAVVRDLDVVAPNKNNTYRFNLHQICAHLPLTMLPPLHRRHLTLLSAAPSFDSV